MIVTTALFTTMNTFVKMLAGDLPTFEIVWARTLGHLIVIAIMFAPRHGWQLFVTRRPLAQVTRSLCLLTSTSLFFFAIGHVPLADATSVSFTSPILVAALAGCTLGERVSLTQWAAVALGFAGALFVIQPTGAGFNPYALLVVGSSTCYAGYQLLTRHVSDVDRPETTVTYSAFVGAVLLTAIVPFIWKTPDELWQVVLLSSLGLFGGIGHYCVARAFALAPASLLSPFHYAQLVWATILGWVVFDHLPGGLTWLGASLIIASGLWMGIRETRRA